MPTSDGLSEIAESVTPPALGADKRQTIERSNDEMRLPLHGEVPVVPHHRGAPQEEQLIAFEEDQPTIRDALAMLDAAVEEHKPSHLFGLFSGGHDSLTATALAAAHPAFTAAVHINTGIGIEETREFVRETCNREGWPLIEMWPDAKTYRDLVIEKGMPAGPMAHNSMFYWLKSRQIRRLVREHKEHRHDRIGLVTGVRASESQRRMNAALAVPVRRNGSQLWLNPILDWTGVDCTRFMYRLGLERNQVVDVLHRSGECLCGALARRSELAEIERWYPDAAEEIHGYEDLAREHGHPDDLWASKLTQPRAQARLPLCWSCEVAA